MGKKFVGLDGLKHFWTKAKTWIAGQITAEVTAKIAELVANAPEDLDTLKEISDWITEHANSAAEMNTQIIKNQDDIKLLQNKTVESCPVGTIMSGLYSSAPTGFLLCNGQEVSVSDYQALYSVIGSLDCCKSSNAGMFKLPDLRECVPVGIGTNSTNSIASHDVYELGQFKDDQLQGHSHDLEWSKGLPNYSIGGLYSGGGSYNSNDKNSTELTIKGVTTDGENGIPRAGTTTHGKQFGVNYIIKY